MATTNLQAAAAEIINTVGEVIRDAGPVPEGELYARMMGFMSLASFNMIIDSLKRAELVTNKNHLLVWVGPRDGKYVSPGN